MATKRKAPRKKAAAGSRGLPAAELAVEPTDAIEELASGVREDGGTVLAMYRDPLAGRWLLLAGLPVDLVEPTPFQLRAFVTARTNPIRFAKTVTLSVDELLDKMLKAAELMDAGKVKAEDVKAAAGYAGDEE